MTTDIKEELAKELLNVIQATKEGIAKGADIAFEEVPEIVNEILTFSAYRFSIHIAVYLLISVVLVVLSLRCSKIIKKGKQKILDLKKGGEGGEMYGEIYKIEQKIVGLGTCWIVAAVFSAISFLGSIGPMIKVLKVVVAPRLYLIEYLSAFLK